jgi:hypothetical protein
MRQIAMICVFAVMAAALCYAPAVAQDMTPEQQQAMMKAMTPGEHHKHLAKFAGKFEYTSKMWMAPGTPPMESKGTAESKMVMGGRYLHDHVEGNYGGMPFEGMGWAGYDNMADEYVIAWIDNMGTMILRATGECSEDGNTITYEGEMPYPGMDADMPFRQVLRIVDEKHHVMEWWSPSPSGGEMAMMMELKFTRVE